MRELLVSFEPNLWFQISVVVWVVIFAVIVAWVYRPSGKKDYEKTAKSILEENGKEKYDGKKQDGSAPGRKS